MRQRVLLQALQRVGDKESHTGEHVVQAVLGSLGLAGEKSGRYLFEYKQAVAEYFRDWLKGDTVVYERGEQAVAGDYTLQNDVVVVEPCAELNGDQLFLAFAYALLLVVVGRDWVEKLVAVETLLFGLYLGGDEETVNEFTQQEVGRFEDETVVQPFE